MMTTWKSDAAPEIADTMADPVDMVDVVDVVDEEGLLAEKSSNISSNFFGKSAITDGVLGEEVVEDLVPASEHNAPKVGMDSQVSEGVFMDHQ